MKPEFRILIVGGYGTFGGRIVELLEDDARLTLLVAGRSSDRARAFCARRTSAMATLVPTSFDRMSSSAGVLAQLRVALVVDASGPFQAYGDERYGLIERCIECGVHYLDLADGSDFVAGVARFDDAARAAGIYVLSGASSFPVLTAAVVRRLTADVATVTSIRGGIAPSPYAGVGLNVIRAIAGYAGRPVALKRGGTEVTAYPLTESTRFVIAVPGHAPLEELRFSLVDVPDLRSLALLWPETDEIWMGAGPVPAILHRLLTGCAWLVRLRLLSGLSWMAPAIHWVTNHIRWGEHRGGMFVEVRGRAADGSTIRREWHLLAEGNDGPLIPSMAVEAIVRNSLAGEIPVPGARTAMGEVALSEYEALFARRTIYTGTRQREPADPETQPIFRRVLGNAWNRLPPPIQQLHSSRTVARYAGRCTVTQGANPLARVLAALVGFPKRGSDVPIRLELVVEKSGERWVRTVGSRTFTSRLGLPADGSAGLIRERFGPMAVDMALVIDGASMSYQIRRWSMFGFSLPVRLGPRTIASESVDAEARFRFDVRLWHPCIGLLVQYAGWLNPDQ